MKLSAVQPGLLVAVFCLLVASGCSHIRQWPPGSPEVSPSARPVIAVYLSSMLGTVNRTRFVLYDDGEVLRARGYLDGYRWSRLDPSELKRVTESLPVSDLFALEDHYGVYSSSDSSTTAHVVVWSHGRAKHIAVIGAVPDPNDEQTRVVSPAPVERVFELIAGLGERDSKEWLPQTVDIGLRAATPWCFKQSAVDWPGDWPNFESSSATKPTPNSTGLVRMPGQYWPDLRAFVKRAPCVEIDGDRYPYWVSLSLPDQEAWFGIHRE